MQPIIINKTSIIYNTFAFLCFWYYYFASTFSLRPFPQLFWIGMAAIWFLIAVLHNSKLSRGDLCFLGSMAVLMILSFFSVDPYDSLSNIGYYIVFYIVARMVAKHCTAKAIHNIVLFFSLIHLVAMYIQVLMPDIYSSILLPLLPASTHSEITQQMEWNGSYHGFTAQTSMAAMYLSVGTIFSALKVRYAENTKSRIVFLVLAVLFLVGIFFTTRRGSTVVVLLIISIIYFRSQSSVLSKVFMFIMAGLLIIAIGVENIPGFAGVFGKFKDLITNQNFMNGREVVFINALLAFWNKPLFGYGVGQVDIAIGYAWLENSYILALVECGIVGAVFFFLPYISSIKQTVLSVRGDSARTFSLSFAAYTQVMFIIMSFIENYFAAPLTAFFFYIIVFAAEENTDDVTTEEA